MPKTRVALLVSLSVLLSGAPSFPSSIPNATTDSIGNYAIIDNPAPDTPLKLRDVWLRFHKHDLCEKIDAAFLFHKNEMEIVLETGDEKSNRKLFEMLESLHDSYPIKLHTVELQTERELIDIGKPPPSFWLNSKLTDICVILFSEPRVPSTINPSLNPRTWYPRSCSKSECCCLPGTRLTITGK